MKVVHLSTAHSWRGGEQQIAYLIDELNKHSVKQILVCSRNSEIETYAQQSQLQYYSFTKKSAISFQFIKGLIRVMRKEQPDIVHIHDSHAQTIAVLSALLTKNSTPFVLSRRVDFPVSSNVFSRFKYNYPAIKKIICVSDAISDILKPAIKEQNKLVTIHSGIDFKKFKNENSRTIRNQLGISEDVKLVGNVAAIADHKDYFTFVDTANLILNEGLNVHFVVIGDGPLREEIETYIHQKGLSEKITLLGFRKDVHKIIYELDYFLFTSKTEGLGTSVIDAMYAGVPVVATKAGGVPELITNRIHGFLSNVKDSDSLSENFIELFKDEEIRKDLIKNAKEKALLFSKELMAKKTLEVYKDILASSNKN
ncbi:MAG: glycosyltransferase family 1 protein [Chitinophagaceae bacterium]|nr:MAG: glycosyltransferase family 1 protein [Chitinophagaceae bacterium]